jgi:hypothetical protein
MRRHADKATKTACVQFNLSPLGFHGWADGYLQKYRELCGDACDSRMTSLLLCRAIEVELKAWHRQGSGERPLSDRFGHNLIESYRTLPAGHRILDRIEVALLQRLSANHVERHFGRLGARADREIKQEWPTLEVIEALALRLMRHGDAMDLAR